MSLWKCMSINSCLLFLEIEDRPVSVRFPRGCIPSCGMTRCSPQFFSVINAIGIYFILYIQMNPIFVHEYNCICKIVSLTACMLLLKIKDRPVGRRFPGGKYTQFGPTRCNAHRLCYLSPWHWASPTQMLDRIGYSRLVDHRLPSLQNGRMYLW